MLQYKDPALPASRDGDNTILTRFYQYNGILKPMILHAHTDDQNSSWDPFY